MKNILYLFVLLLFFSCKTTVPIYLGYSETLTFIDTISIDDFNSFCQLEGISDDFNNWLSTGGKDVETNNRIKEYIYITNYNDIEYVYIVQPLQDTTKIKITIKKSL